MQHRKLRIYDGSDLHSNTSGAAAQDAAETTESVTVTAGDVLPVLADALASGRTWLRDFENDEITIPIDLYEVILAYQHYRRLSA